MNAVEIIRVSCYIKVFIKQLNKSNPDGFIQVILEDETNILFPMGSVDNAREALNRPTIKKLLAESGFYNPDSQELKIDTLEWGFFFTQKINQLKELSSKETGLRKKPKTQANIALISEIEKEVDRISSLIARKKISTSGKFSGTTYDFDMSHYSS